MKHRKIFMASNSLIILVIFIILFTQSKLIIEKEVIIPSSNDISSENIISIPSSEAPSSVPSASSTTSKIIIKPKSPSLPKLTYLNVKGLPDNNIVTDITQPLISSEMVNLQVKIPTVNIDLRYATKDNFTKKVIYDFNKAYLRRATAEKLKLASDELKTKGYTLLIWDAYRPPTAQFKLWEAFPDPKFVADPNKTYSKHSCGSAVDLTLMKDGEEVEMPSAFDEFDLTKADRDYSDATQEASTNAKLLEDTLKKYGFEPYKNEWWHFQDTTNFNAITFDMNSNIAVKLNINAVGDCVLGNDYRVNANQSFNYYLDTWKKPTTYFLQNFRNMFLNDDLTIANAENVFTNSTNRVEKPYQPTGAFWLSGRPSNVNIFRDNGVDAVSVANNHSLDYGTEEFSKSVGYIKNAKVNVFGYGNHSIIERKGIKIGLLSYNLLGPFEEGVDLKAIEELVSAELKIMSQYTHIQVVSFHWGIESTNTETAYQQAIAKFSIDNGADLILGTHPHVIQPVTQYKGRTIAYSLANFCYGGAVNSTNNISFVLNVSFDFDENKEIKSCKDDITPAFTHDLPTNNYCPSLATEPAISQIKALAGK
jgi:D-alanyl-D-alanine dipeptidase